MKVLLIGNYLPDCQGSMQLYAKLLERGLGARGHQVRLLHPSAVLGERATSRAPVFKWLGYLDKFVLFRTELRRAALHADVVHVCDHSNAMYVPALEHLPHVVTCHDVLAIRSAMGQFPVNPVGATGRIFQRLIARGLRRAKSILCVSTKTRDDLREYLQIPEARLHVVPNALHWPYTPLSREQREPVLAALGVPTDAAYFFHLGGDHWYKNRGAVVAIAAELRKLPPYRNARLVMAGAPLTAALRAQLSACGMGDAVIEVAGPSNEQVGALYSGALATLFPSLEEGFGWPILESQACGCPVAIADRAPMNEVAGGTAILIDPARPQEAAQRVAAALKDTTQLRAAGLENAAQYSVDTMVEQCEALYRAAIDAARRRS